MKPRLDADLREEVRILRALPGTLRAAPAGTFDEPEEGELA